MTAPAVPAMEEARVVPVLTVDDVETAALSVAALHAGGLGVVEITLRSDVALDAIRACAIGPSIVGAGSVMTAEQVHAASHAGASFIVSPGLDAGVVAAGRERQVPVIPGIATATELMQAAALGVDLVKVFPAEVAGGPSLIRAYAEVWPRMRFMPTGGISAETAAAYLSLQPVLAVGGSWMIHVDDAAATTESARAARTLADGLR